MIQFEAKVRDLSHKGLGVIDHPDGRVFFVRGVWPGDEGTFVVDENAQRYDEAKLILLKVSSPERVPVRCEFRGTEPGKCGGCTWMMANYPSQLHYKAKRLLHALEKRKVDLSQTKLNDIISSTHIFGYRNRIQLKTTGDEIGYVSEASNVLSPVSNCYILNPTLKKLFDQVRESLPRDDFRPTGDHHWSFLDLDDDLNFDEIRLNKRRPFKQGNAGQNLAMKSWLQQKLANIPKHLPVIDLFCGSGNLTEVMVAEKFENILAVEVQGAALEKLKERNLPNVRILDIDLLSKGSWARTASFQPHAKVIVVDPPREGLHKRRTFLKYFDNLETLIYISCELDTFARDVSDFVRAGFVLEEVTPIDLFPHTPHVEILSVLSIR